MRSDMTAAAQIRDAAMRLFGARGPAAVTIRDVAAEAGVSPALVIHHYKSKDGLKQAVDDRAMALLGELFAAALDADGAARSSSSMVELFAEQIGRLPNLLPYLRRLLVDGGEPATELFRGLFAVTRESMQAMRTAGVMAPVKDEDVLAAFLLVNDLGAVILRDQLADVLGFDPMSPDGVTRWGETVMAVYSSPTFIPSEDPR